MELSEAIINRRSIYPKIYTEEIIDHQTIKEILESAKWAPSHRNTRPWHFVVFEGKGRDKLAEFQAKFYKENTNDFSQEKYDKLKQKPLVCSHVIAICMKRDPKKSVPEIEEIEAVACAVQNMHLTAASKKIGAYWGTGGVTYQDKAKPFFKLEEDDKLLGFFFLGIPKINWPQPNQREIKDHIEWISE